MADHRDDRETPVDHPLTGRASHETGSGLGDWVGNVHGDGGLLVFNTWSVCDTESTFEPCPEGVPSGIYDENLWRIVGRHKRLLVASRDEMTVLSVAADRILVQRADGSLELRGADGSLLRAFPFQTGEVRAALLDSSELVVLDRESGLHWRVYDPASGEQKQVFPAVARMASADVERGLLVYTVGWGRFVHVLRLVDGRRTHFTAPMVRSPHEDPVPVLAQIEPSGLFYSYQVRSKGRVRFVPFNQIGLGG